MKPQLVVLFASLIAFISAAIVRANEDTSPLVIRNSYLEIRADKATGRLTIAAHGKDILRDVEFAPQGCKPDLHLDNEAGSHGEVGAITLNYPQGITVVRLFKDDPFARIATTIPKIGHGILVQDHVPVFQGIATLEPGIEKLKILGTGGLAKPGKRNGSYMWLAAADPETRNGIVAGFVTSDRGSGVVFAEVKDKKLQIDAQIDGRFAVGFGKSADLEAFAVGYFDDVRDGLEAWADAVAQHYAIELPPQPCGYCTWYHAGASSETAMVRQTEIAAKELKPYGFTFEQIDDGWQDGVTHNGPRKNFTRVRSDGPYPSGMKATADMIRAHGLTPGIWFMPFSGTWNDPWFKDHQDWFAKWTNNKPFDTPWGGTSVDMTNPGARKYLYDYVHQISHDWDYKFFKMDGLSTGAAVQPQYVNLGYKDDHLGDAGAGPDENGFLHNQFHDPSKTNIEAFRSGLKLVREAAGPDVFILGCCAPQNMRSYGGAFGLVDAMRVGPDNGGGSWQSVLTGPRTVSRNYHLNGRIWYNDPDVVYVRKSLTLDQARANASWVAITGQLFMVSDDFSKLTPDRLDILKRVMPSHGLPARPVDLLEEEMPRIWHVSDARGPARRDVVGLFNWDDKASWDVDYPLDRIGLPEAKSYVAYDFWGDRLLPPMGGRLKATLPKSSCLILSIRPEADHPQLISTSRHVTQGMIDVTDEKWDPAAETLSGTSKLVPGDLYELRIATGGKWQAAGVDSSLEALKPKIKNEEGLVRVRLTVPPGEPLEWKWKIKMAK